MVYYHYHYHYYYKSTDYSDDSPKLQGHFTYQIYGIRPHQHIIDHFGDESFQSTTCTSTDNLTRTTKRQNTQITQCKKWC